ncbi:MAG: hypothetical protein AAGE52_25900 [Myxococcota bacterium]
MLEALCQGEPTPERWRDIVEVLESLGPSVPRDRIERLNGFLAHWPDELRATMCRLDWDERMVRGEADPRFRLFRHLKYDSIFIGRYTGIMMRSPKIPPGIIAATNAPSTWDQLAIINLQGQRLTTSDLHALARARLPFLKELVVEVPAGGAEMIALARWAPQLESLTISSPEGDALVSALAQLSLPKLRHLDLDTTRLGDGAAIPRWNMPSLEELRFNGAPLSGAMVALARWNHHLETLSFRNSGLDARAIRTLVTGALSADRVDLFQNPIGDAGLVALGEFPCTSLTVRGCDVSDEGLAAFAKMELRRLAEFAIGPENYGDDPAAVPTGEGLLALLDAPHLERLQRLEYTGGFTTLRGRRLAQLEDLRLETSRHCRGSAIDGAELGPQLGALKELHLSRVEKPAAFFSHRWVHGLERIFLRDTALEMHSMAALAKAEGLKWALLGHCGIDPQLLGVLLESRARPKGLLLPGNPIGDRGASMIAASDFVSQLERLGLHRTGITNEGAFALADSETLKHVERVFLTGNAIDEEAVDALARRLYQGWRALSVDTKTALLKSAPPRCCP